MTSEQLREIFKQACAMDPPSRVWPELKKFGMAVVDACAGECEEAAFSAALAKAACHKDGTPAYNHKALDCVIGALEQCAKNMRSNVRNFASPLSNAGLEWVSVREKLPDAGTQCLTFTSKGYFQIRVPNKHKFPETQGNKVTHWMPLPKAPT